MSCGAGFPSPASSSATFVLAYDEHDAKPHRRTYDHGLLPPPHVPATLLAAGRRGLPGTGLGPVTGRPTVTAAPADRLLARAAPGAPPLTARQSKPPRPVWPRTAA